MRRASRQRWLLTGAVVGVASLVKIAWVVRGLSSRFVNEDQASVLLAARELLRLRVNQPSFPGQHYGVVVEGLGAALGQLVGIPVVSGLVWSLALLWFGGWLLIAGTAWHAGARGTALLAAGAPLLLSTYAVYYPSVYTTGAGRFLAVAGAVLLWRGAGRLIPLGVGLAVLAVVWDPSAVVLPLMGAVLGWPRLLLAARAQPLLMASACLPGLLFAGARRAFAAAHPDYGLHAPPDLGLSAEVLGETLRRAPHYLEAFAPAVVPDGRVLLALLLAMLGGCVVVGGWRVRVAASLFAALTLLVAATPRALDDVSLFLPGARLFLPLPYAVALLGAVLELRVLGRLPALRAPASAAAVLLLVVSVLVSAATAQRDAAHITAAAGVAPVVPQVPVPELERRCAAADELARTERLELVVYLDDRAAAYGCPVLAPSDLETLLPTYERRTWRLYAEQRTVRDGFAVVPGAPELCATAAAVGVDCAQDATGAAVLRSRQVESVLETLDRLGIAVRPFGPGCTPGQPETCP